MTGHNVKNTDKTSPQYMEKLWAITQRPRAIHEHPEIIIPSSLEAIPEERLFRKGKHRRILELGSGWGDFLHSWLENFPEDDYVAFEIKQSRLLQTIRHFRENFEGKDDTRQRHLRLLPVNFTWFLEEILPKKSFDIIFINFPDPWPKQRHWKHRLVQKHFDKRISLLLRAKGMIHMSTDYGPYARKMIRNFRNSPYFSSVLPWPHYVRKHPKESPITRFEKMHFKAGLKPYYLCWQLL